MALANPILTVLRLMSLPNQPSVSDGQVVATKLDTGWTDLSGSFSSSRIVPTGKGDANGTAGASACPWQSVQLAFVSRDIVTELGG